jgi:hypothetical protein
MENEECEYCSVVHCYADQQACNIRVQTVRIAFVRIIMGSRIMEDAEFMGSINRLKGDSV